MTPALRGVREDKASLNHNDVASGYARHSVKVNQSLDLLGHFSGTWPSLDNLFPDLNTPDLVLTGLGVLNPWLQEITIFFETPLENPPRQQSFHQTPRIANTL